MVFSAALFELLEKKLSLSLSGSAHISMSFHRAMFTIYFRNTHMRTRTHGNEEMKYNNFSILFNAKTLRVALSKCALFSLSLSKEREERGEGKDGGCPAMKR